MVDLSKPARVSLRKPAAAPLPGCYRADLAARYRRDPSRSADAKARDTGRRAARKGKAFMFRVGL